MSDRTKRRKRAAAVADIMNNILCSSNITKELDMQSATGLQLSSPEQIGISDSDSQSSVSSIEMFNISDESIDPFEKLEEWASEENEKCLDALSISSKVDAELKFWQMLGKWATNYEIRHNALKVLLEILQSVLPHMNLPKDPRTLLKTPRTVPVEHSGTGSFSNFDFVKEIRDRAEKGLKKKHYPLIAQRENIDDLLTLSINIDGLPIGKDINKSFWPVLGRLDQSVDSTPFLISLFVGESKPQDFSFLASFIDKMKDLEKTGLIISGKKYSIDLSCIIADAPARSFIKSIKQHNGYDACEKCVQKGEWSGRVVYKFLNESSQSRKDSDFKNLENLLHNPHHNGKSPFSDMKLGLVTQVPLDYMHLVVLGVTKKMLCTWIGGPPKTKIPSSSVKLLSEMNINCVSQIPSEFARKPRSLSKLPFWKATELRLFLLYTGPVILKKVLPPQLYEHFLLLSTSIFILCSHKATDANYNSIARDLLVLFVKNITTLYRKEMLIYNIHSLLHLADDCKNFGNLDQFSAFPFENYMQQIKKKIRSGNKPLQQVWKRFAEQSAQASGDSYFQNRAGLSVGHFLSANKFQCENFVVATTDGDNCFLTDLECVVVVQFETRTNSPNLICKKFLQKSPFFLKPCDSSKLNILTMTHLLAFSVVEFDVESTVDVVPSTWLVSGSACWWPANQGPGFNKLQRLAGSKPLKNWKMYPSRIIKCFGTFQEAEHFVSRGKYVLKFSSSSSSAVESEEENEDHPVSCSLFATEEAAEANGNTCIEMPVDGLFDNDEIPVQQQCNQIKIQEKEFGLKDIMEKIIQVEKQMERFAENVFRKIEFLQDEIESIKTTVNAGFLINHNVTDVFDMPNLPICSFDGFNFVEDWLSDVEQNKVMVTFLAKIGGSNYRVATRKFLSKVLSDEFATKINWTGRGIKIPFKDTKLNLAVQSAVQLIFPPITETMVEDVTKSWFRFAKDRMGGREARRKSCD